MSLPIPDDVRNFLETHRFATIATLNADGSPHQVVAWYLVEGDTAIVNSADGRRWPANLRRDPRVSLVVSDGYAWVGLRGTAAVIDDQERAQADIAAMAYLNHDRAAATALIRDRFRLQRRVSFHLRPTEIHAGLGED